MPEEHEEALAREVATQAAQERLEDLILQLRDSGQIGDDALRSLERDLDLEELRIEA